jgi:hypothetical protein
MLARGRVQGAEAAYDRFALAMGVCNSTRFWGQRYSWLASTPQGSDVITDFTLYGGLLGSLGIRTSLLRGVEVLGPAAAALKGGNFTFALRGRDITVHVAADGLARVLV